jgi:hypothetical protein
VRIIMGTCTCFIARDSAYIPPGSLQSSRTPLPLTPDRATSDHLSDHQRQPEIITHRARALYMRGGPLALTKVPSARDG